MKRLLKAEKIMMFIPLLNFMIIFPCVFTCLSQNISMKQYAKNYWRVFIYFIPVLILTFIADKCFPDAKLLIVCATMYFSGMALGYGCIKFQQKIGIQDTESEP